MEVPKTQSNMTGGIIIAVKFDGILLQYKRATVPSACVRVCT